MMDGFLHHKRNPIWMAVVLLSGLLLASPSYAGVGMLQEGENMYNSDLSVSLGNKRWNFQRKKVRSLCNRRNVALIQGYEYGYSYFHTVYASATFAYRNCIGKPALRQTGLGDIELGVRTRMNNRNTAAWEVSFIIPTGYDNNAPSRLGRGAFGIGLGVKFASQKRPVSVTPWGWDLGSQFLFFLSGNAYTLISFAQMNYAFSNSNFEQTGDFMSLSLRHSFTFGGRGLPQRNIINQPLTSLSGSDRLSLELSYSHGFGNGWSTSLRGGKVIFGKNMPEDYLAGWGINYRWRN